MDSNKNEDFFSIILSCPASRYITHSFFGEMRDR